MKPTIYDVAKKAKVSITTVSKVANKAGRISDKTREKGMINITKQAGSSIGGFLYKSKRLTE